MSSTVRVERYSVASLSDIQKAVSRIRQLEKSGDTDLVKAVSEIVDTVKRDSDSALINYAEKLDSVKFRKSSDLKVTENEIRHAYSKVSKSEIKALKTAYTQVAAVAREQNRRFEEKKFKTPLGFEIDERYVPLERIGGYIPGGLASYPSTVLMICVPAKIAGVKEIVLTTPPRKDGSIKESVLVAADICGVKEILKSGGAQAVAALAFGTKSIKKVDLIAGPGNKYVTEAKRQVVSEGQALIDSLAGPTELLVMADKSANQTWVVEDLVSQAEHGNRTLIGLVSNSASLVREVQYRLTNLTERPRMSHIQSSKIFTVFARTKELMLEFAQSFSPEHLEVMMNVSENYLRKLTNSGLVLVGDYTPCSSTDYIVGTNHILPTGGMAKHSSGLAVENFLRRVTTVKGSKRSLGLSYRMISTLANNEDLPNHGFAAVSRFKQ